LGLGAWGLEQEPAGATLVATPAATRQ